MTKSNMCAHTYTHTYSHTHTHTHTERRQRTTRHQDFHLIQTEHDCLCWWEVKKKHNHCFVPRSSSVLHWTDRPYVLYLNINGQNCSGSRSHFVVAVKGHDCFQHTCGVIRTRLCTRSVGQQRVSRGEAPLALHPSSMSREHHTEYALLTFTYSLHFGGASHHRHVQNRMFIIQGLGYSGL